MILRFIQIQCVPVQNTNSTQCNVYMYGLTADGELWFKRDTDFEWQRESRFHEPAFEKTESNPRQEPRGVWIEFTTDGKKVIDIIHEPKNSEVPDNYIWCEESR